MIRNPHGTNEWTGDWSDSDERWNDQDLRRLLNHERSDDGIFFMSWKDYLQYYPDF